MARTINCDLCGKEMGKAGSEKRVALPVEFVSEFGTRAKTARVQIHIFAEDGRLTIPELCAECVATLVNADPIVAPAKPSPIPTPEKS